MVDLAGRKALIVEDEGAVALLIEDMLLDLGCEIAASVAELGRACEVANTVGIDFAVLDLNLNGYSALPVAQILRERGIPFIFSTGYGAGGVSQEFAAYPILPKPFISADLRDKIAAALRAQR
jgi:CheY-like chemotaxis protein